MNDSELMAKIKSVVAEELGVDENQVTPEATFSDLGADDLMTVGLRTRLEHDFELNIPGSEAVKIVSLGSAYQCIRTKIN